MEKITKILQGFKGWGFWLKKFFIPGNYNNYRPKILEGKYFIYILILACLLRLSTFFFFTQLFHANFFADIAKSILIESVNEERKYFQIGTLKENILLNQAALLKANDMLQKGYFAHISPTGITPWYWFKKVGYDYKFAGENLGIGFIDSKALHEAWNNSPSHRANLLNGKYEEIGIGVVKGSFQGAPTTIVVQLFGTPKTKPIAFPKPTVACKPSVPISDKSSVPTSNKPFVPPSNNPSVLSNKPSTFTNNSSSSAHKDLSPPVTPNLSGVGTTTLFSQATANLTWNFPTTASAVVAGDSTSSFVELNMPDFTFISTTTVSNETPPPIAAKGFWANVVKFFANNYNDLTQKIVFVFLVLNVMALLLNIVIKIFVQHYDLIAKSVLICFALILLLSIGPKEIAFLVQPTSLIF